MSIVVQVGQTVRAGGTGALLCGGYLPAGDWRHNLLMSDKAGKTVRLTRAGDADCRLQWAVYKASVGGTPEIPKTSVCQDLGTLTMAPDTVYIVVVDKPDPTIAGPYGLTVQ